jgi:hypothetical protein
MKPKNELFKDERRLALMDSKKADYIKMLPDFLTEIKKEYSDLVDEIETESG